MTPVFLNPPPSSPFPDLHHVEKKEDPQLNLFINSQYYDEASSSLSSPTFLINSPDQDQRGGDVIIGSQKRDDQKGVNNIIDVFTSSQNLSISQRDHHHGDVDINGEDHMSSSSTNNNKNGLPVKQYWMSSKMRLMQKMSNPETPAAAAAHKVQYSPRQDKGAGEPLIFSFSQRDGTSGALTRVCSDCNTTTTPLWRSGPRGPKSLCNACGIRQRKARRAMAEAAAAAAANGLVVTSSTPSTPSYYKSQYHINKEMKKSRPQYKNKLKLKLKLMDSSTSTTNTTISPKSEIRNTNNNYNNNNNKLCLTKFSFGLNDNHCSSAFSGVFPNDVAEAAVLLMELSCGFVHS